ncbi:hypothetical protein KSP40_PGU021466 [Platanthera guangdongensis]|uniref:Uncharacterized protein n=1 Tax=Platanthera guangdongensis TaxID=2320717 RepID=A0ABR2N047_9ASPA
MSGGHEAFVECGFSNWKKKERLIFHIGDNLCNTQFSKRVYGSYRPAVVVIARG